MALGHALLFGVLGVLLVWMSRSQPFPEHSKRFGYLLLVFCGIGLIAHQAEREVGTSVEPLLLTVLGGVGVVVGMRHVILTRMDVLIAPASGLMLTVGTVSLLSQEWTAMSGFERYGAFTLCALLVLFDIYLVFRTLLIGKLALAWSQAGLRQLRRGLIHGEAGAIACFEKAWDNDEEHLNAMAYLALAQIHQHLGQESEAGLWQERLSQMGGGEAVDPSWSEEIASALKSARIPSA